MKKMMIVLVALLLGSHVVTAESYQRWIYWLNQPNHAATVADMVEITTKMNQGEITPWSINTLKSGVTYKIPQPELYLSYIVMCVKSGEPDIKTVEDVIKAIAGGEVIRWGNDMNCLVKNYWFSTRLNKVTFTADYSGADFGIFVLIINKKPKIKCDCGNPLQPYNTTPVVLPTVPDPVSPPVSFNKCDTIVVKHIWAAQAHLDLNSGFEETKKVFDQPLDTKKPFLKTRFVRIGGPILAGIITGTVIANWDNWFKKHKAGGPAGAPGYEATGDPAGAGGYNAKVINQTLSVGFVIHL
jgi:hypothetical protein